MGGEDEGREGRKEEEKEKRWVLWFGPSTTLGTSYSLACCNFHPELFSFPSKRSRGGQRFTCSVIKGGNWNLLWLWWQLKGDKWYINACPGVNAIFLTHTCLQNMPESWAAGREAHSKGILGTACLSGLHWGASYAPASHSTLNKIASLPSQVRTSPDPPVSLPSNDLLRASENSRFV